MLFWKLKSIKVGRPVAPAMGGTLPSLTRLEYSQLDPNLAAKLEPRVRRLGYLGEFFKCAGHQPEALAAFMEFTEASKKGLTDNLVETIALTAANWMGNAYERNQHERLALRLGFDREWVAAINRMAPDSQQGLPHAERLMQRLVLEVLDTKGVGAATLLEQTIDELGDAAAVAALMVLGRYVVHGLLVNALGLKPPVPSIFEDQFAV
ncbi:MAG TPA: carboxymuconolactone decarboxylase family protein [Steroidobacteraceae bacterium]|jgi:alkylhydroperoxidase family enzyme